MQTVMTTLPEQVLTLKTNKHTNIKRTNKTLQTVISNTNTQHHIPTLSSTLKTLQTPTTLHNQ